jgi:hypothetical protein
VTRLLLHVLTCGAETHPTTRAGLRGRPLRWIEARSIGGWATIWEGTDSQLRREDLFEHHRIVEWAWQEGACLPVRFPAWLGDEKAFQDLIDGRETALVAALERVRGQAEIAVTVLWADEALTGRGGSPCPPPASIPATGGGQGDPPLPIPSGPGRRYLEARREEQTARDVRLEVAQRFADALDEELLPLLTASEHRVSPTDRVALSSALLAPHERASELGERVARLSGGWEGTRTLVNGPWPPYSFAGIET